MLLLLAGWNLVDGVPLLVLERVLFLDFFFAIISFLLVVPRLFEWREFGVIGWRWRFGLKEFFTKLCHALTKELTHG